jgi:hypothetical protein
MLNNKTTDIAYVNNSTTINSLVVNNAFVNQSIIEDGFVLSSNTSVSVRNTIFRIDNSQNRFLKTDNTADNSFSPSGSPYYFEIMWKSDFNGGMYIVLFSS